MLGVNVVKEGEGGIHAICPKGYQNLAPEGRMI